ncbi:14878_t:CDS:2, partial [Gigaspora rosea]
IFRTQYTEPILNSSSTSSTASSTLSTSSTNLKTPLLYTEKIAQKKQKSSTLTNKKDEFTQYLSEAVLPMEVDPLNWWKLNYTRFPKLSKMVKDYLAIQSTSVLSEQWIQNCHFEFLKDSTCLVENSQADIHPCCKVLHNNINSGHAAIHAQLEELEHALSIVLKDPVITKLWKD